MLDPENVGDDQPRKRRPTHIPLSISQTTEASQRGVVNPRGSQGTWQADYTQTRREVAEGWMGSAGSPCSLGGVPGRGVHTYPQLFTAMRSPTSRKG